MRPLKISLTAFGPYKHSEVIDFSELKGNRLFVISGNTGAGKTTIFDAICFALYGSASGEDRSDVKGMRSDFADDDVHTSVELEFELRGRYYRIKRQLPHVKKGNKTATGEQYEFFEKVNDQEIPCVDRQRVSDINQKIEELLGLTKDQFSQIVMLPQGEFRKLLTSQTENKEDLLRKIFKTERYTWISQRLKEKKLIADEEYKREKQMRDRYMADIHATIPNREGSRLFETLALEHYNTHQVLTGMEEESLYYGYAILEHKKEAEARGAAYNIKLEEFHKAESLNGEFLKLEAKEKQLQELSKQGLTFKDKEQKLEKSERASKMESFETQVIEWRNDEKEKQSRVGKTETEYNSAVELLQKAEKNFQQEENKKDEREEISKTLVRYQELLPTVKEIDRKKQELASEYKQVQKLAKDQEELQKNIQEEKQVKTQLGQEIKTIEQKVDTLPEKQLNLHEMREKARVLQDYLKLHQSQAKLDKEVQQKYNEFHIMEQQYKALEAAWISGQASILAAHLHDGKPCPVCGSIEHPEKALGQNSVPTKEELEMVKSEFNQKDSTYRDIAAKANSNQEQLKIKAGEVLGLSVPLTAAETAYTQLVDEGKRVNKEVELLLKEKEQLGKLKRELEQKEEGLVKFEAAFETAAKAYQERNTAFESNKAVYQEQLSRTPEELRNLPALEGKICETQARITKLEQAWEAAQKMLQSAKENETKAKTNLANAQLQLKESSAKKEKAEQQFIEALHLDQFEDEASYRIAKMTEEQRTSLKQEIDSYHNTIAALTMQIKDLQATLSGKTKADMPGLKSELEQLKSAYENAQEILRKSEQYLENIIKLKDKISESDEAASHLEQRLNVVTDLYDVVRGQNNSKVSFERYLQIEFLEQIIVAANERLKSLSNGQFVLMRSERQEARGKQSGLGLDVYDAYTGQTRDVKTLSGGEKFNASLCLALGMADVIQSFQGGVSIDTMFIDEGFGSLDDESLTKAIDTLIDLQQSGRMIGVISHVQELKNAIPAILEVKKTKEGHSQTQFIIR
ncbi:AAA family ATPase [Bacillus benzoevorans]|uniref:Nuclease SbcCD subunit C n=1 Tax=Bacillus benzoevorans TaxID=1456 RepID=A0A7X0HWW5_9BACI|nr:SMC family ATPase [Bacillus benzoevorans]MBB6447422.1 exonuclease SbcC [Bacillus benzoevorans]